MMAGLRIRATGKLEMLCHRCLPVRLLEK
jgi:hypothetical protein